MNCTMIISPKSGKVVLNICDYDLTKAVKRKLETRYIVKEHNHSRNKLISTKKV